MKKKVLKKVLAGVISLSMVLSLAPAMAFAAEEDAGADSGIYKWSKEDWTTSETYGDAVQDADQNVTILTGGEFNPDNNGYNGPYSKAEDDVTLENGNIVREVNVLIGPKALDGGSFGVTASLDKPDKEDGNEVYLTEMNSDFRAVGADEIMYSANGKSDLYRITEDAVYTVRWEYSLKEQGVDGGGILYGKQSLLKNDKELATTGKVRLKDGDLSDNPNAAKVSNRSIWFYNISVDKGIKVFENVPAEDYTMQTPVKWQSSYWVTAGERGTVDDVDGDAYGAYVIKGGKDAGNNGPNGPYSRKCMQSITGSNVAVNEINVLLDPKADVRTDGPMFSISSGLGYGANGTEWASDTTMYAQKVADGINIYAYEKAEAIATVKDADVYTLRWETSKDIFTGDIYSQFKLIRRGTEIAKTGTVNITARDNNDLIKKADCQSYLWFVVAQKEGVTVYTDVPPYLAESIELNKDAIELTEEETAELTATVGPEWTTDKTVAWTSSDEAIATVKDGVVTAVKEGKAIITAAVNGHEAACEVTVNAKPAVAPESVKLNKTKATIAVGKSVTVTATVGPEDTTDKTVTWTSNKPSVATVANGKITAKAAGTATVTATAVNGKKATVAVTVTPKQVTGVKVKAGKKYMTVSWKKDTKATGYQVQYAQNKSFTKGKKTVAITKYKTTSKTIKKLKSKKTYYAKVRAYKTVSGKKIYGAYSAVKTVKVK